MRDIKNNVDVQPSINPANYSADQTGSGVDLRDFDSAMAVVQIGTVVGNTHTPKIQESDDDAAYTDVAAADLEGVFVAAVANSTQRVGYKGAKRFIRVFVTSTGASAVYGAQIIRGKAHSTPVA
jgi:Na+-translocating ferredoxin:NAD+ oxidoreductase RnfG subunit